MEFSMLDSQYIKRINNLLNRFILESKKFVNYACFPYGTVDYAVMDRKTEKFAYDFEYFAFTKSTKTLMSIRELLKMDHNEDALMLVQSIFENYLATRYAHEYSQNYDDFIFNPMGVALGSLQCGQRRQYHQPQ
jgi:hypothetical protein